MIFETLNDFDYPVLDYQKYKELFNKIAFQKK